jgi:hypothetical protein
MISSLYDSSNNLITETLSEVLPHLDSIKIKNRLLNGTYHIQTVGTAITLIDITCTVNETGKQTIDDSEAVCSPITLKRDGKYYKGLILNPPQWNNLIKGDTTRRKYTGQFTLTVTEEGVDA